MKLSANKKGQICDEINRQMFALRRHLYEHETLPITYITQKMCELEATIAQAVIEIVEGKKKT
jgi:hypothetical protein